MEKNILIMGPENSGKTNQAHQIASRFAKDEVVFASAPELVKYASGALSMCNPKTKLIVVDDITTIKEVDIIVQLVRADQLEINARHLPLFSISPKFILVITKKLYNNIDHSTINYFYRKFKLIATSIPPEKPKVLKEQDVNVTTFIKFDMIDRFKILFGRCLKIDTKVVVPQELPIESYNAVSNTSIISSSGHFVKQDKPPFGYTSINN